VQVRTFCAVLCCAVLCCALYCAELRCAAMRCSGSSCYTGRVLRAFCAHAAPADWPGGLRPPHRLQLPPAHQASAECRASCDVWAAAAAHTLHGTASAVRATAGRQPTYAQTYLRLAPPPLQPLLRGEPGQLPGLPAGGCCRGAALRQLQRCTAMAAGAPFSMRPHSLTVSRPRPPALPRPAVHCLPWRGLEAVLSWQPGAR
jgi:hypothetical protein